MALSDFLKKQQQKMTFAGTQLANKASAPKTVTPTTTTRTPTTYKTSGYTPSVAQSVAQPAQVAPQMDLAQQYANMAGAQNVYKGPMFNQVLPFYQAWEKMQPMAQAEAEAQINPFVQRQYGQDYGNMMNQMAQQGSGRFGAAMGNVGALQAETERNRRAQLLDWIGQRRQGFEQLFYNPSETAFNQAIERGQTPTAPTIPTWDQFNKQYNLSNIK